MTTSSHADLLAELLSSNGVESIVRFRLSDHADPAVTIWPYSVDDNSELRNQLPPRTERQLGANAARPQRTHALVVPANIDAYDKARQIVCSSPILAPGDIGVRVMLAPLPIADLTALFVASNFDYRLSLSVVIE